MKGPVYRAVSWKYTLTEPFVQELPRAIRKAIDSTILPRPFLILPGYSLVIGKGYSWDGASGPTVDTDATMRASLAHDALYQCMRIGALDGRYRAKVDRLFRRHLAEDGVNLVRRWLWYRMVRWFGGKAAKP